MSTDVQRLSRTINLPRIPASFTPEQRAYFDDFARAITEHMRDTYDCLGVSNTSLKAHEGTNDAHGMAEAPTPGVGIIRTDEGKARVVPPDDLDGDDYVATIGSVRSFASHVDDTSEGVHGSSASPSAGCIAMYSSEGRLKGANPVDSNDCVTKSYYDTNTQRSVSPDSGKLAVFNANNRLQSSYPASGEDVATYEFIVNAIGGVFDRLVFRTSGYPAASAGSGLLLYSVEDGTGQYDEANGLIELPAGLYLCIMRTFGNNSLKLGNTNNTYVYGSGPTIAGVFRLSSADTMQVLTDGALGAQARGSRYGVEIISL